MILTCPSCATRYLVDPDAIGEGGRMVRCASCRHTWFQEPSEDLPKKIDLTPVGPTPAPLPAGSNLPALRNEDERTTWVAAGWITLAVSVVILVTAAYMNRIEIIRLWPPAERLYAALNIPVSVSGMQFRDVSYAREFEAGINILAIKGEIVNITDSEQSVPRVRVVLRDAAGQEIYNWTFNPPEQTLAGGASVPFETRLSSPPLAARDLEVRFVDSE